MFHNVTQPSVRLAGFHKTIKNLRIRELEGWLSGLKHLTANEAVRNGTGVRISHLPQTPRDVQRAIPASRLNILNTQWQDGWRVIPQGVVQSHELKRQRKRPQYRRSGKRRYPIREYNWMREVISESESTTGWCIMVSVTQQHT